MTSPLVKLAEPLRTPFLLVSPTPTAQLPVVADPAAAREAIRALRVIEADGEQASRDTLRTSHFLRETVAWVGLPFGIPAAMLGIPCTLACGAAIATGDSSAAAWLGVLALPALAAVLGGGYALVGWANRKRVAEQEELLQKRFAAELDVIEKAMPGASSLELAWLAQRAETAYLALVMRYDMYEQCPNRRPGDGDRLDHALERGLPGAEKHAFAKRLSVIADQLAAVSEDDLAQVKEMRAIYDTVFVPARRYNTEKPVGPDTTNDKEISDKLESMMRTIEQLKPEARSLLRVSIADAVARSLSGDSGNTWRAQRFLESFDCKYAPYRAGDVAIPATIKLEQIWLDIPDTLVQPDAEAAARYLTRQLADRSGRARVRVVESKDAEAVAAYFEERRLLAVIYRAQGNFVVTVHNPARPPSGAYVRGED